MPKPQYIGRNCSNCYFMHKVDTQKNYIVKLQSACKRYKTDIESLEDKAKRLTDSNKILNKDAESFRLLPKFMQQIGYYLLEHKNR